MTDDCFTQECCETPSYPVAPMPIVSVPEQVTARLKGLVWSIPGTLPVDLGVPISDTSKSTSVRGNPGQIYTVNALIRGVVEAKSYASLMPGQAQFAPMAVRSGLPNPCVQYTGVVPFTGGLITAVKPGDTVNEYGFYVSDPEQYYLLNHTDHEDIDVHVADYTFTFQVRSGATIIMPALTVDAVQAWNYGNLTCPDPGPPALAYPGSPAAYLGQWMQMDALTIT